VDANFGVKIVVANSVVFCVFAAKEVRYFNIDTVESFDALPPKVQETTKKQHVHA